MIEIKNLKLAGIDNVFNKKFESNVINIKKEDKIFFNILNFKNNGIVDGQILIDDKSLNIYADKENCLYDLKINFNGVSLDAFFDLQLKLNNDKITNLKKNLLKIKKIDKVLNEKFHDIINLLVQNNVLYITIDLNYGNNFDFFEQIISHCNSSLNVVVLDKTFVKNISETTVKKHIRNTNSNNEKNFKFIIKNTYPNYIFYILFSVFLGVCSFPCIQFIRNDNALIGSFLLIISLLFLFLTFYILYLNFSFLKIHDFSKKYAIYIVLIDICCFLVGFSIGYLIDFILHSFDIFIDFKQFEFADYIYSLVVFTISFISPIFSFFIYKVFQFFKKLFLKNNFDNGGRIDE